MERVKHYVVRGITPTLLLGEALASLEGSAPGWLGLVQRVRRMAPALRVVLLRTEGSRSVGGADLELARCDPRGSDPARLEAFLDKLAMAVGLGP